MSRSPKPCMNLCILSDGKIRENNGDMVLSDKAAM